MKNDYPDKDPINLIHSLIDFGIEDKWHGKNITSFKYLFYNAQKIIASVKSKNKKIAEEPDYPKLTPPPKVHNSKNHKCETIDRVRTELTQKFGWKNNCDK